MQGSDHEDDNVPIQERIRRAREEQQKMREREHAALTEATKVSEQLVILGYEINNLRLQAGLPQREIILNPRREPLPDPKLPDRRFPIPHRSRKKHGQDGWQLAQLTSDHFEVVLEIQEKCYESHHCEEVQAYIDRLHFYPEGSIVLIVPKESDDLKAIPPPPSKGEKPHKPETIAGYVLFQPFFRGEVHMDADIQGLLDRDRMVKEGLRKYDCMYIHEMSVHPAFRGKSCTGPLLAYVEDYARKQGYSCVSLVSLPAANDYWVYNGFEVKYPLDYEGTPSTYMEKLVPIDDT